MMARGPGAMAAAMLDAPAQGPAAATTALVSDGLEAFALRAAVARKAQTSLDLQYYIWNGDLTGRLLAREALLAADRGVKVRLLLDDMYAMGRERGLSAMDAHPNLELRLFNATNWRRWGRTGFLLEMLFGGWHLNRRMHNKAWIADGEVVICGGRNIGDRYFDASGDFNFRDLDLIIDGEVAAEAARMFEAYWNCPLARPISRLARIGQRRRGLPRLRARMEAASKTPEAQPFLDRLRAPPDGEAKRLPIAADAAHVLADGPEKVRGHAESAVAPALIAVLAEARREVLIISPYFVPGDDGATRLTGLARSGVRVAVVTNSLAATDVVAVHGGYARYREPLLEAGVELYELKASGEKSAGVFGSRGASLHTKALVVDGKAVFVGSFNLDPRSTALNTEMGVLAHQSELAELVREEFERLADAARSWRLRLVDGGLAWDDGAMLPGTPSEPGATLRRRVLAQILRRLPIESQL